MSERLYTLLTRIAEALEAQREPEPDPITFPLSDWKAFAWSSIGATVVARDEDGVSAIRTAEGKVAKRRSNDKYGTEVWYSYAVGKKADGSNDYRKVVEFKNVTPAEPLGRKTEQAARAAAPAGGSPLMPRLIERYQALLTELTEMGETPPADLTIGIETTPPIAQGVLDKLASYVSKKRDSHRPLGHSAPAGAGDGPIAAAKAWLADGGRRASADNMTEFAKELARHMKACGCVLTTNEPNLNRKRDAFAAWILEQVPA